MFVLFAGLMHFIYAGPPGVADLDRGLPGHDSFYHVKMAQLMPEIGLIHRFPWLRTTVFYDHFVNHHYGFQWLMSPFVRLADRLTGDPLAGGRWFITVSFGLSMALVQLLLMIRGITHRWVWLALCLLLPVQFYGRHYFVRAISPSLVCMLLLCICLFTRRHIAAAVVIAGSIQVYLGAVLYVPAVVAAVAVSAAVGLWGRLDRDGLHGRERWNAVRTFWIWRLLAWAVIGWLVGLAVHPYGGIDVLRFLKLQVFGSGLSPDIPVGREWKSYTPAWFFVNMSGVTLTVTAVAVCVRMRLGPRLNTNECALLLINLLFLVLTLKARRFIEYWPVFSILSAAYCVCPALGLTDQHPNAPARRVTVATMVAAGVALGAVTALVLWATSAYAAGRFLAEWRWWTLLAGLCALVPIARCWADGNGSAHRSAPVAAAVGVLASGAVLCVVVGGLLRLLAGRGGSAVDARLHVPWWCFAVLGAAYLSAGWLLGRSANPSADRPAPRPWRRAFVAVAVSAAVSVGIAPPAGAAFVSLQDDTRCLYDLPALRALMQTLESVSKEGAVVFTDDWDVFPVYFYLNHRNHYIVGLDPKFSHEKDPALWEAYVRISRGEVPRTRTVKVVREGRIVRERIDIRLTDIRDRFDAEFVIVDRDHNALARKLDAAPEFAERIFPVHVAEKERPPYKLYRIKSEDVSDGGDRED